MNEITDIMKCEDCGQPIHRTAPGTGYAWAHDDLGATWACRGTDMVRPADSGSKAMGTHEKPQSVLDRIEMAQIQARARETAAWMSDILCLPVDQPSPIDGWSSDNVEVFRVARDLLELLGGVTHG